MNIKSNLNKLGFNLNDKYTFQVGDLVYIDDDWMSGYYEVKAYTRYLIERTFHDNLVYILEKPNDNQGFNGYYDSLEQLTYSVWYEYQIDNVCENIRVYPISEYELEIVKKEEK